MYSSFDIDNGTITKYILEYFLDRIDNRCDSLCYTKI